MRNLSGFPAFRQERRPRDQSGGILLEDSEKSAHFLLAPQILSAMGFRFQVFIFSAYFLFASRAVATGYSTVSTGPFCPSIWSLTLLLGNVEILRVSAEIVSILRGTSAIPVNGSQRGVGAAGSTADASFSNRADAELVSMVTLNSFIDLRL